METNKKDSPEFDEKIKTAGEEAEKIIKEKGIGGLGACHDIWEEQKRILKERHGIDWKTPAERHPEVRFD